MNGIKIFRLIICLTIPLLVGGVSGYATVSSLQNWYPTLVKPSFNPPNYLFGPVWTLLYLLMGVSLYIIWSSPAGTVRNAAIFAFALQLFLNFWWSILFFGLHHPLAALAEIIAMWFAILYMIIAMRAVSPTAAYLQVPYLLWVSFATLLNAAIWWLNSSI